MLVTNLRPGALISSVAQRQPESALPVELVHVQSQTLTCKRGGGGPAVGGLSEGSRPHPSVVIL